VLGRFDGVGDRDTHLGHLEQRVVVLGVADRDRVVRRQPEIVQRLD